MRLTRILLTLACCRFTAFDGSAHERHASQGEIAANHSPCCGPCAQDKAQNVCLATLYTGPLPFDAITLPKLNNTRERFLTPGEARALLDEIQNCSRQTWLLPLVSLHCGLRLGEIASLRWENIDFPAKCIWIPESKSGRARHVVMTNEVKKALLEMQGGKRADLVFPARGGGVIKEAPIPSTWLSSH